VTADAAVPDIWDPAEYQRYAALRVVRPTLDLLARVRHAGPRLVVDLGCGPGDAAELVAGHWPGVPVIGVDISPAMLAEARKRTRPGRLEFRHADLRTWCPDPGRPVDVLLAGAVLQWIPDHIGLLPRFAGFLPAGGVLGFQMPVTAGEVDRIIYELCDGDDWRERLATAERRPVCAPVEYLAALTEAGLNTETWETTYTWVLDGADGIFQYALGAGLRPMLARLEPAEGRRFLADFAARVNDAHPPTVVAGRTVQVLPARRIFVVGRKPDDLADVTPLSAPSSASGSSSRTAPLSL
jgi:trans-aconitate 2-methyltransferase